MPGPGGMDPQLSDQTINKTEVASSRRGVQDNTGHQQFQFNGTATGAGIGASFGGGYGAAIGAGIGLIGDTANYFFNKKQQARQQRNAERAAAVAYGRQRELLAESERYNSVQNKVDQLRQAGLNPALAYGDLGSVSVSTPSAPQADTPGYTPVSFGSAAAGAAATTQALLNEQAAASAAQDVVTKQITNKYLDTRSLAELQRINAQISKDLADTSLSDEQRKNLQELRDYNIKLMLSQVKNNYASADKFLADKEYVEGAATDLAAANAYNATEQGKTQQSVRNLNNAKVKTEQTVQDLNVATEDLTYAKITTEETVQNLNRANQALVNVKKDDLAMQLHLTNSEVKMIDDFVKKHDLPQGSDKALMLAFEEFGKGSGKGLSEFLSGTNWMRSITEMVKIFKWDKSQDDDYAVTPGSGKKVVKPLDDIPAAVTPNPSKSHYEQHREKLLSGMNDTQRSMMEYFDSHIYPKLSETDQYNYRKELYDTNDPDKAYDIQKKYYGIYRQYKSD